MDGVTCKVLKLLQVRFRWQAARAEVTLDPQYLSDPADAATLQAVVAKHQWYLGPNQSATLGPPRSICVWGSDAH